jgi:hypothetical protein
MKKYIYVIIGLLAGYAIGYGVASSKTGPHIAYAQLAPTPMMCSNGGGIPAGYVVVNTSDTNNCNNPDGTHGYLYQLKKLVANPSGGMGESICSGTPVPGGFVTTGWNQNPVVCKAPGSPTNNQQSIALYN